MAKAFAIGSLIVVGLIVADIFSHPSGTAAASKGVTQIETPVISGLVNSNSTGGTAAA